jgi:hypothetical protein
MSGDNARSQDTPRQASRKPYTRPDFAWEEDFEPYVFSTCGKMPAQGGACSTHRSS